jgi:hypothetical protein
MLCALSGQCSRWRSGSWKPWRSQPILFHSNRIIGVPLKSYVSLSWTYHLKK